MTAKAARAFGVPLILTTVETRSFSGGLWPHVQARTHCGAYGPGVEYACTMVHGAPPTVLPPYSPPAGH